MKKNKKFTITFKDNDVYFDVDYILHDSLLAEKWFKKIKHLSNIPINEVESGLADVSNLNGIYLEFCKFAKIPSEEIYTVDQALCNHLHQIYEDHHERLSKMPDNSILYRFHHAIHFQEKDQSVQKMIKVGWGTKEGPLTHQFKCGDYYEYSIRKNNLYLPWSELGKTPLTYWRDKEPNDQSRFNELAKPHTTFRAKFAIALQDSRPSKLDPAFVKWFDQYKQNWLEHHGVQKWDEIDEYCSPLLASTDDKIDLLSARFHSIALAD